MLPDSQPETGEDPISTLEVFVTAGEAYPALERLFLSARSEVKASFRVFDLSTRLRSAEALSVGDDWFDLFADTLRRGVDITLTLSDFDPIVATDLHRVSWASAQKLAAVADTEGKGKLTFRVAQHPARAGLLPRIAFSGKVREKLNQRSPDEWTPGLQDEPGIPDLTPATHHQKIAVFDREILYIGGLDLDERRYDTDAHDQTSAETWQDVQVCATGPVVAAALRHIETFEAVTEGRKEAPPPGDGFLRTMSARRAMPLVHIAPKTVCTEIFDAHIEAFGRAEGLIYLETQYFRERALADALARRAADAPDLRVIVVLPGAPEDVAFEGNEGPDARFGEHLQTRCLCQLQDALGERLILCSPVRAARDDVPDAARLHGAPIVYVHSKVSLFSEREAIVSSANLNGRSMHWDTEAGLLLRNPSQVEMLRRKVMGHWMPEADNATGTRLFDIWMSTVKRNLSSPPMGRSHYLLPHDLCRAEEFGQNPVVVPNNMV